MATTKAQKREILQGITEKVEKAKSVVFAQYDALTVKENEQLRNKLRAENSEYLVAKKTLLDIAFREKNIANLNIKDMEGKVAAIFGYSDEVAPAKIIAEFQKAYVKEKKQKINFLGGILEGKFIDQAGVSALSKLPSKQELYAKMVGSLNAPISGFVNVLAGNIRGLVNVLNAVKDKKQA